MFQPMNFDGGGTPYYKNSGNFSHTIASTDTATSFTLGTMTINKGTWLLISYIGTGIDDYTQTCNNAMTLADGTSISQTARTACVAGGGCYNATVYRSNTDGLGISLRGYIPPKFIQSYVGKTIFGNIIAYKLSDNI